MSYSRSLPQTPQHSIATSTSWSPGFLSSNSMTSKSVGFLLSLIAYPRGMIGIMSRGWRGVLGIMIRCWVWGVGRVGIVRRGVRGNKKDVVRHLPSTSAPTSAPPCSTRVGGESRAHIAAGSDCLALCCFRLCLGPCRRLYPNHLQDSANPSYDIRRTSGRHGSYHCISSFGGRATDSKAEHAKGNGTAAGANVATGDIGAM